MEDYEEESENDFIRDVIASMGWSDSFLPIASEENKKLLDSIKYLGKAKLQRDDDLEIQSREDVRVQKLLENVDNEFDQNLKLVTAHKSQYAAEHHLLKLAEHEHSKYRQMSKEIAKEISEFNQAAEKLKSEKERINESMTKVSEGMQWAKSALIEWRQVMASGDEANKMIEKLCRVDAGRAETLDSKRKLLHESITKQRALLVNLYEERKSLELLLERTSQLYRQAHLERRQLVNTWKDAVTQMNQREKEIKETEMEVDNAKKISTQKHEALSREESVMKLKQTENREIEMYIQELNITSSEMRNRLLKLDDTILLKNSELLALRKTVQGESQKLSNLRNQNRQMLVEEKDKENALRAMIDECREIREKYDKFKGTNSDAQERLRQIEELLENETKNMKRIEDETSRLTSALFRSEQQLKKLQDIEKSLLVESQALESGISKTRASCKGFEKELLRQTEILYNVEYKIQHAEMRLATMQGTVDEEETARLDARRTHLEQVLDDKTKAENLMKTQITRTEEDMKKLSSNYQNSISDYEKINEKLKEKKIYVEGGEKQQKILLQQNQEKLVEQNLLKIKISQLEKLIAKQADRAFSLERHKMELEAATHDRLIDIRAQMNVLQMRRKCLIEERNQMKADVVERLVKIEQLKKRYACAMDLLGRNEDGTTVTAVQIKIQMAQEKYMLLNEGNQLNDKIAKAETEVKYMENALKLMNFSNDEYRKVFDTIQEDSPEMKRMYDLQNQYCQIINEIKILKSNLISLIDNLEVLENQRVEMEKEYEEVQRKRLDHNDTLLKIHKDLLDQDTKKERADREMKLAYRAAKRRIKDEEFMMLYDRNIELGENEERGNSALHQMADLMDNYPEMSSSVTKFFIERGLSLPANIRRAKSQCSWKSETSIGELSSRGDPHCSKRFSHRSICSGSSTPTSQESKTTRESSKITAQTGLSVVKITFPEVKKISMKKTKRDVQ